MYIIRMYLWCKWSTAYTYTHILQKIETLIVETDQRLHWIYSCNYHRFMWNDTLYDIKCYFATMNDNRCICWYSTDQTGNKVSERQVLLLMFTNSTQFRFLHGFSYYIGSLWTAVKRNIPIVSWVMVMLISGKPTFLIVFWNVCPSQHVFISTTTRLQTTVFWGWVSVRVWSLHLDSWSRHLDQLKTSVSVGGHLMNLVVYPCRCMTGTK